MRNLLLTLALALAGAACAGAKAREHAAIPATALAMAGVMEDIEAGLAHAIEAGELSEQAAHDVVMDAHELLDALRVGTVEAVRAAPAFAPELGNWALRGIDAQLEAGTIGPGVAESLRERVRNLREALGAIVAPHPFSCAPRDRAAQPTAVVA